MLNLHAAAGSTVSGRATCKPQTSEISHRVIPCQRHAALRSHRERRSDVSPSLAYRHKGRQQLLQKLVMHAVRADQQAEALDTATVQLIAEISKSVEEQLATVSRASTAALQAIAEPEDTLLRSQVKKAINKLQKGLLERDTEVRLMLLAALCGEHLLLLGPPGTAKSELSRRLSGLCGGAYFERLLTRFSVPEELFGPLSMKGLENDEYVRQTAGYLPTAEVAFVDEIFKANSAILNALLTLLNERLFDNGNQRLEAPLLTLVGASNELPESEELDALYDRFLVRRTVAQVSNGQVHKLARLAAGRAMEDNAPEEDEATAAVRPLCIDDFKTTADAAYDAVDVPDTVIDLLTATRNHLQDKCEPPMYVSDRRFMKSVQLLQVAAHADGRSEVNEYDCVLLEYVFGNRPDDSVKVRAFILETIASDPGLQQTELVFLGLFGRGLRVLGGGAAAAELAEARQEAATLADLLADRHKALTEDLDGGYPALKRTVWQSEGSMQAAVQALTPQMTENRRRVEELLKEALTLKACLDRSTSSSMLERLLPKRFKQYQKGVSAKA